MIQNNSKYKNNSIIVKYKNVKHQLINNSSIDSSNNKEYNSIYIYNSIDISKYNSIDINNSSIV